MNRKLAILKRIVTLYGLTEEMHSVALRVTAASVQEAENAIAQQTGRACEAASAAREALGAGDRQQWVLAGAQRELSELRWIELERIRHLREIARDQAQDEYAASRIKSEQLKAVVEQSEAAETVISGRRAQATTDDRFLSRLLWNDRQIGNG